ncbi:MAG TPA: hypothetical protein H9778_02660 [Candidatus Parabacteroides intestinavium]|nr:hypothetical protein [Candidatus Parabacteroides intestinavium]
MGFISFYDYLFLFATPVPAFFMTTAGMMAVMPVFPIVMPAILAAALFLMAELVVFLTVLAIIAVTFAAFFAVFLAFAFVATAFVATTGFVIPAFGKGRGKCRE